MVEQFESFMGLAWIKKKKKTNFYCLNCNCFLTRCTKSLLKSRDSLSSKRFRFLGSLSSYFTGNKSLLLGHFFLQLLVLLFLMLLLLLWICSVSFCLPSPVSRVAPRTSMSARNYWTCEKWEWALWKRWKVQLLPFTPVRFPSFSVIPRRGLLKTKAFFFLFKFTCGKVTEYLLKL